ncbi:MAG: ComEC/Rec2 family competence protein, partial [Halothece sp.]
SATIPFLRKMYGKDIPLLCLAYIIGLLIAAGIEQYWLTLLIFGLILGGMTWKFLLPQQQGNFHTSFLIIVITLIGFVSFYLRFPTITANDVSQIIPPDTNGIQTTVVGRILNSPTLNREGRLRFWLSVEEVENQSEVNGKLYVTLPEEFEKKLTPDSVLEISGYLYQPQIPNNPRQFNFQEYLNRNGAFAGISGKKVTVIEENTWGLWWLRERIIKVHFDGLGNPKGTLLSAMVLGRRVVSLPSDLQEQFLKAGLAHILAASGFHVSLLLGAVLAVTQRFSGLIRFGVGITVLIFYIGVTGLQPSILRASLMGVAVLLGLLTERKVNSQRSLLVIATILLLINPLWIIDLGFQFSFLATFGLIITTPFILRNLEFIPPTIASMIAVPIAVFPWIFPLQLFYFGTVATYSIILNIFLMPFVVLIIFGGMLSAGMGLIFFQLGSTIALFLSPFIQLLITVVRLFNQLPGFYLLFGQIALWQVLATYALMIFIWRSARGQQYWKFLTLGAIALLIFPITYQQLTQRQITVFATPPPATMLIQNRGDITLINCGNQDTIDYTISPFLEAEGIQNINHAIALHPNNQWQLLKDNFNVKTLWLKPQLQDSLKHLSNIKIQAISTGNNIINQTGLQIKRTEENLITITFGNEKWLILNHPKQTLPRLNPELANTDIILWEGTEINQTWLEQLIPKSAIAITNQSTEELEIKMNQRNINFYSTAKNGAIQWTPQQGLNAIFD